MSSALWIGTTGLAASERMLDVIGNNLANSNTVGFKASDANFASLLNASAVQGSQRVGQGVMVSSISSSFSQGSFQSTDNATDIAIDGNGFFIMRDKEGANYYSRSGAFYVNKSGLLCDLNGYTVQGNMFGNDGIEVNAMTDLDLRNVLSRAKATTTFTTGLTLDSAAVLDDTFTSSQTFYDSLGTEHTFSTTFTKTATTGQWDVTYSLDGPVGAGLPGVTATGSLTSITFGPDGALLIPAPPYVDATVTFGALPNGATIGAAGVVTWDFTSADAQSLTSFATTSRVSSISNDGYASGTLTGLNVNESGVVEGIFSNGKRQDLARILLADFANVQGLNKDRSYYVISGESGNVIINNPGSGGVGSLRSNALEMSNTDVATEFIKMITAQRAYQANAKIITTSDEMLQQLMAIKQ
jgi:flagellar hook protein FlgE